MAYVYLIVALSWLLGLLCLAVLLAPPVLWFLHRRDANFARPVRWVATSTSLSFCRGSCRSSFSTCVMSGPTA